MPDAYFLALHANANTSNSLSADSKRWQVFFAKKQCPRAPSHPWPGDRHTTAVKAGWGLGRRNV
jgi:hypothetical protein